MLLSPGRCRLGFFSWFPMFQYLGVAWVWDFYPFTPYSVGGAKTVGHDKKPGTLNPTTRENIPIFPYKSILRNTFHIHYNRICPFRQLYDVPPPPVTQHPYYNLPRSSLYAS
ncbi:uncharacterized protein B0H64DRAFT_60827 [Chaetomium fimeti]|uniref:Uncharacterized protein n=1 Tax=Chaetomium fimeti TaxID=1854472 RepID=A0AAE0LLV6_9PEZI|nr:hypothetical protein B0H64DRAFT_60827 [Chaetomium fimeti]